MAPLLRGLVARFAVSEGEAWCRTCPSCAAPTRLLPPTGRCPRCRQRLGAGAWTVEAAAAAVAVAVVLAADGSPAAALAWAAGLGVVLAFVDGRVRRLPYRLTLPLAAGLAVLLAVAAVAEGRPGVLARCLLVALAAGALFELPVWLGLMGPGDSPLAFALGGLLGWYGWGAAFGGLFFTVLLAGLWAVLRAGAALARRRPVRGLDIPVGPFLLLGTLTAVLVR
ncbi:prepilin peptidase [Streptomyces sp. SP17BM10]|uniref:prepilin peptidase n=1 Tax=Streptomyces sp. SP17BM10 TaxID=3002530 RepID=UPI002E769704|nr:prepilin peptidase [Streptomyces sp. SP17BM10]MEE1784099.1 prepilin peptidase [Streptomyces sp. SP17BM10]